MIYVIRHGKTELNRMKVLQGRSNYPLNAEGLQQAKEAAEKLRDVQFDFVFSSPLDRAVQTAEIVVPGIKPILDERLIEMDYGPYEGADLKNPPPEILSSVILPIIRRRKVWRSWIPSFSEQVPLSKRSGN